MSETLNFTKLADAPILDEVPDGAKVYAEVEGKVYRVAGDNLGGGGIPTAILDIDMTSNASTKALLNGGAAAVSAGENSRATVEDPVYTATCGNMTYDEVKAIFSAGGQVNARLRFVGSEAEGTMCFDSPSVSGSYLSMGGVEFCGFDFLQKFLAETITAFYWLPDGTITTDMSVLGG